MNLAWVLVWKNNELNISLDFYKLRAFSKKPYQTYWYIKMTTVSFKKLWNKQHLANNLNRFNLTNLQIIKKRTNSFAVMKRYNTVCSKLLDPKKGNWPAKTYLIHQILSRKSFPIFLQLYFSFFANSALFLLTKVKIFKCHISAKIMDHSLFPRNS